MIDISKLLLLVLASVLGFSLLSGCVRNDTQMRIPVDIEDLSLTETWNEIVKITGIQDTNNAYLESMKLRALGGKVQQLRFEFYVLAEPEWTMYSIFFDEKGILHFDSGHHGKGGDNIPSTVNPKIVFSQIDRFGLTNIRPTVSGFTIDVMKRTGSYTGPFLVYHLENGILTPLALVKLSTERPGLPIQVGSIAINNPSKGIDDTYTMPEYWFLSEDLNRAEIVEYLEN